MRSFDVADGFIYGGKGAVFLLKVGMGKEFVSMFLFYDKIIVD